MITNYMYAFPVNTNHQCIVRVRLVFFPINTLQERLVIFAVSTVRAILAVFQTCHKVQHHRMHLATHCHCNLQSHLI